MNWQQEPNEENLINEYEKEAREKELYIGLLGKYHEKFSELKKLEAKKKRIQGAPDEELDKLILFVDRERDDIHKELRESGTRLGKNEMDIMTDILRQEGSLAEYGLPEFFFLDSEDMLSPAFNIDLGNRWHGEPGSLRAQKLGAEKNGGLGGNYELDPSAVVVPFVIKPKWSDSNYGGAYLGPEDSDIRTRRALELAKTAGLEIFADRDYQYFHDSKISIFGVVVPKNRIAEIAATIRDDPDKFRVGEDFYSEQECKEVELSHRKLIEYEIKYLSDEDKKDYWNARKMYFGEEPPEAERAKIEFGEIEDKLDREEELESKTKISGTTRQTKKRK
jgi:hypothetical protein